MKFSDLPIGLGLTVAAAAATALVCAFAVGVVVLRERMNALLTGPEDQQ